MIDGRIRALPRPRGFVIPLLVGLVGSMFPGNAPAQKLDDPPAARIGRLNVVVLSTMLADTKGVGEWGFAALVEADGHRILFDTGARPATVLNNARELGLSLKDVTDVVLSHHHGDHTGGLMHLRRELAKENPDALSRVYVGTGLFLSRPRDDGTESNESIDFKGAFEASGGRFVEVGKPTRLFPGAWLTGPVPRTHPERNWSGHTKVRSAGGLVEDTIPEDMSLVLDTDRGLVVVSGCGHAGIVNTLEYARKTVRDVPVHAALGGFHLFPADEATLDWTAGRLRDLKVGHVLGAHCTGIEAVHGLRTRLGLDRQACVVGAVGAGFDLIDGIRPGTIAR
jgi:7,8-dihydropterin-6-yl-methyl-4-(beta-D-ribofuranosyl)aminobenzene 5'-phosphate synthase